MGRLKRNVKKLSAYAVAKDSKKSRLGGVDSGYDIESSSELDTIDKATGFVIVVVSM